MVAINWTLVNAVPASLDVEQANEDDLQLLDDVYEEIVNFNQVDSIDTTDELRKLFIAAQKVVKLKGLQTEAAVEELENAVRSSSLEQENEKLRREIARLKKNDARENVEEKLQKLQQEMTEMKRNLTREKQNHEKFKKMFESAESERKALQMETMNLQAELDERIKGGVREEESVDRRKTERQYLAKIKEKNDQVSKLMLVVQEEEQINEELRNSIDQLAAKLRDATHEINNSADIIEELKEANSYLLKQDDANGREIKTLEALVDEYMGKINELERMQDVGLDTLSRRSSTGTEKHETWRSVLEAKDADIREKQVKIMQLEQEIDTLMSSTHYNTLTVLKRAIVEKDQQIKSLTESLSQATLDIEDNTRIIESLRADLTWKNMDGNEGSEMGMKEKIHKLEEMNAALEKHLIQRDEQLTDALLVARKYEMGVYGLSDAVAEVRVCKRKLAARDKNIERLSDQLADCYIEIEHLKEQNEQLCQGVVPKEILEERKKRGLISKDSVETERTIVALEDEIVQLKQSLYTLQKKLVDNVHKISKSWSDNADQDASISSNEDNFSRCQISEEDTKRIRDQLSHQISEDMTDAEMENQRLKEFLIQVLEALQRINKNRRTPVAATKKKLKTETRRSSTETDEDNKPVPLKRTTTSPQAIPTDLPLLKEYISDIINDNQRLIAEMDQLKKSVSGERIGAFDLYEWSETQLQRQRSLQLVLQGALMEQITYLEHIHDVHVRQLKAMRPDIKLELPKPQNNIDYDHIKELKDHINLLNRDIMEIKKSVHESSDKDSNILNNSENTHNLYIIEKLRLQVETLNRQYLKSQKTLAEHESEMIRLAEKQPVDEVTITEENDVSEHTRNSYTEGSDVEDEEDTIREESQTESERSLMQGFWKKMDNLRQHNRKLCQSLSDAKHMLQRTQDALKLKELTIRETAKQQAACGNHEQKISVLEISLDTSRKLLSHKEKTLERYRQLVTELKQELVTLKVRHNSEKMDLEKKQLEELYEAKRQIAQLNINNQAALVEEDGEVVYTQVSFEKILAEKQVQIVQLQNRIKAITQNEFKLNEDHEQAIETNKRLRETILILEEKLRCMERKPESGEMVAKPPDIITTAPEVAEDGGDTQQENEHNSDVDDEKDDVDDEKKRELEEVQEKLEAAMKRIAKLKGLLDSSKERVSKLEEENEAYLNKIEQMRKISKMRKSDPKKLMILENEIDNLRRQIYQLKNDSKGSEDVEKQIKQAVQIAKWESTKKMQSTVQGLKDQLKDRNGKIEQMDAVQNSLRAQIRKLEQEKYKLQDKLKARSSVSQDSSQKLMSLQKRLMLYEKLFEKKDKSSNKVSSEVVMQNVLASQNKRMSSSTSDLASMSAGEGVGDRKESRPVSILRSPQTPRKKKSSRSVSFDESLFDDTPSSGNEDISKLEDEPIPPAISKM